ncbi:hypothetical protein FCM35_KLT20871 [Carex littledalei]|uniref:Uncharacterized protein n=1 Tax=Carex littledalei TaxID=544730 RepID=A0A833RA79_9POAL|nr:hypothetical protein FCM35_KLT20871 [Carex littledalei]
MESGSDSDAPEELTAGEGIRQHEEIRKAQRDNVMRVAKEGKERRRQWAQKRTVAKPEKKRDEEISSTVTGDDHLEQEPEEKRVVPGMLPKDIVDILAAREKQTFSSDSEEDIVDNKGAKKKKNKKRRENNGPETVVLSDIPPPQCLKNSIDFLKRRKMRTPRSTSILKNADHALCLLSSKGGLLGKS